MAQPTSREVGRATKSFHKTNYTTNLCSICANLCHKFHNSFYTLARVTGIFLFFIGLTSAEREVGRATKSFQKTNYTTNLCSICANLCHQFQNLCHTLARFIGIFPFCITSAKREVGRATKSVHKQIMPRSCGQFVPQISKFVLHSGSNYYFLYFT